MTTVPAQMAFLSLQAMHVREFGTPGALQRNIRASLYCLPFNEQSIFDGIKEIIIIKKE